MTGNAIAALICQRGQRMDLLGSQNTLFDILKNQLLVSFLTTLIKLQNSLCILETITRGVCVLSRVDTHRQNNVQTQDLRMKLSKMNAPMMRTRTNTVSRVQVLQTQLICVEKTVLKDATGLGASLIQVAVSLNMPLAGVSHLLQLNTSTFKTAKISVEAGATTATCHGPQMKVQPLKI